MGHVMEASSGEAAVSYSGTIGEDNTFSPIAPKKPLGYILSTDGSLCPFGLLPAEVEAETLLGEPISWKEIKVCPPVWILLIGDKGLICPADFCHEKLKKNISFESHLKKHLSLIVDEKKKSGRLSGSCNLPSNILIKYYCGENSCGNGDTESDNSRNFSRLKYLKQHYFKVHAPKTFDCKSCDKSFATLGFLETHNRMCGNSFDCSDCLAKYRTLEALQTHCRRKSHEYNYARYRDLINTSKQETNAKKAEETLKQKLAAVSLSSKKPKQTGLNKMPMIIPRPKEITTCGPGGATSHVTWTFEHGNTIPKLKVEMGTQTQTETESQLHANNTSTKSQSLIPGSRISKRKKSAETQTGKLKFSIETQTSNVVKRRRASKKQIAVEAETQCSVFDSLFEQFNNFEPTTEEINSKTDEVPSEYFSGESDMEIENTPIPLMLQPVNNGSEIILQQLPNTVESLNLSSSGISPESIFKPVITTSEMCVGNRFDEVAQQLFNFEEFHRETQTDLILYSSAENENWENILNSMQENDMSDILNVTAETQTWPDIFDSSDLDYSLNAVNTGIGDLSWDDTESNIIGFHTEHIIPPNCLPILDGGSPTYLETMDSETQTSSSNIVNGSFSLEIDALINETVQSYNMGM